MRNALIIAALTFAVAACSAAAVAAEAAGSPVKQPTTIPGKWELIHLPLPPIKQIVARPLQPVPVYGVYLWGGEYRQFRNEIKQVGWQAIRLGGAMDDETMKMMCQDGVEVMKGIGIGGVPGLEVVGTRRNQYPSDEAFIAAAVKTAEALLTRYGPGGTFFKDNPDVPKRPILHLEIWNEPNFQYMIPPREGVPGRQMEAEREALYAKLLPAVYKAIKARWPKVQVVGFGAGGAGAGDMRFIQHVHEDNPAVAKSYDILSTHPYTQPAAPEVKALRSWGGYSVATSLKTIRDTLTKYGRGDAPIWYTEVGWVISHDEGGHFKDRPGQVTLTQALQAAYVCRMYALAMRLGVDRVHIMFITDSDNFNGGFFRRSDSDWRKSAYAVQTMIHLMPHPRLARALIDGEGGNTFAYEFIADGRAGARSKRIVMAWNVAGPKTVELPCTPAKATLVDMLGHKKTVEPVGGKVSVEIGPCPVYLVPGE